MLSASQHGLSPPSSYQHLLASSDGCGSAAAPPSSIAASIRISRPTKPRTASLAQAQAQRNNAPHLNNNGGAREFRPQVEAPADCVPTPDRGLTQFYR